MCWESAQFYKISEVYEDHVDLPDYYWNCQLTNSRWTAYPIKINSFHYLSVAYSVKHSSPHGEIYRQIIRFYRLTGTLHTKKKVWLGTYRLLISLSSIWATVREVSTCLTIPSSQQTWGQINQINFFTFIRLPVYSTSI